QPPGAGRALGRRARRRPAEHERRDRHPLVGLRVRLDRGRPGPGTVAPRRTAMPRAGRSSSRARAESCSNCGRPVPAGATRCPACGEPVVAGERKLVTLLFADLSAYTALAHELDHEEVYRFIRPALAELVAVVEGFGGSVPQVLGDGFMAVFGVPVAHEDDPERAVRAGLAVVARLRELNAETGGMRLPEVHAGVNTGEAMVAPMASEPSGFTVVGDTVNVASRIAGLAAPGHVLAGEQTVELSRH